MLSIALTQTNLFVSCWFGSGLLGKLHKPHPTQLLRYQLVRVAGLVKFYPSRLVNTPTTTEIQEHREKGLYLTCDVQCKSSM